MADIAFSGCSMLARLAPAAALLTLLAACSSMSEVTSVGKDTYSVTYSSGTQLLTWVELKNQTLQRADQYCQGIGRKLQKPKVTSNHATGLGSKRATVTFECGVIDPPKDTAS
ncbi:Hyp domain-containing protein 1 [Achromobacter piechaudii]|nr:Hyp domain-containing protein 1 [Achromobacter piechaudii]